MREGLRALSAGLRLSLRADRWRSLAVIVPAGTVLLALTPRWLKSVIDAVVAGERDRALLFAGVAAASSGLGLLFVFGQFMLRMRVREAVSLELDRTLIVTTSSIPTLEHHERPDYADRLELLRTRRGMIMNLLGAAAHSLWQVVELGISVVLLVSVHPAMALLVALAVPTFFVSARTQRRIERAVEETAPDLRRALHLFDTATDAGAAKELRVFRAGDALVERHMRLWDDVQDVRERTLKRAAVGRGAAWLLFSLGYAGALALAVNEAIAGRATAGDVVMAVMVAARLNEEATGMAFILSWLVSTLREAGRYLWLLDHAAAVRRATTPAEPRPVPDRLDGGIRIEGLSFAYPGSEALVLQDVDLVLPAGSTVALVGDNGAGKTTLVKLLCRLYDPAEGRILVDGADLRDLPVERWRERLAAGFQDFARFEVLAHEAVGVGDVPRVGDVDAARDALVRAAAVDVVEALPHGLETQLGPTWDGVDLSGGQWQKLALGRALMRQGPLLLLLDEPTAAIDAPTEHALFERYQRASRAVAAHTGGVTLLVSHRFSTVRMADLIVVIEDGRVTEVGAHADLVRRGATYAELYELQARSYR